MVEWTLTALQTGEMMPDQYTDAVEWARERLRTLVSRSMQLRDQMERLRVEQDVLRSLISELGGEEALPPRFHADIQPRLGRTRLHPSPPREVIRGAAPSKAERKRREEPGAAAWSRPARAPATSTKGTEGKSAAPPSVVRMPPKEATEQVLAAHPGELTRKQVVDMVMEIVETEAKKPRNVIYTVLRRMERDNEVEVDRHERLWLAGSEQGQLLDGDPGDETDENNGAPDPAEAEGGS